MSLKTSLQTLLPMCTLMSVPDSRQWVNTQTVRMFGKFCGSDGFVSCRSDYGVALDKSHLSPGASEKKWDRVRIICTQPYNKVAHY